MNKIASDLVIGLVAAFVGTAVVTIIDRSTSLWPITYTLAAFALVVFVINKQDTLALLLRSRGGWELPTRLRSTWSFETDAGGVVVDDVLNLKVTNSFFCGVGISRKISGDTDLSNFRYRLRGEITPDGFLRGRWWTDLRGRNFSGVFHLQFQRGADVPGASPIAKGKWIGISRRTGVRAGDWTWYGRPIKVAPRRASNQRSERMTHWTHGQS